MVIEAQGQMTELNGAKTTHTEWNHRLHDQLENECERYSAWINLMRHSLVLLLGSIFEDHLKRMAESLAAFKRSSPIHWNGLKNKGLKAVRQVLIEQGIASTAFAKSWCSLIDVYKIRNKIAHAGGRHDQNTAKLLAKMPAILGEDSEDPKQIWLVDGSVEAICGLMANAMKPINQAVLCVYTETK